MAWTSKEEQAMSLIQLHMRVMPIEKKTELNQIYSQHLFSNRRNAGIPDQWDERWGIVFITMAERGHLLRNIGFAMIQEMLGLGPTKYCIVQGNVPEFYNKLLLLLNYLPREKLCFYPPTANLRGPFERSPWRERGEEINNRRFSHEDFDAPGVWKANSSRDMVCIRFTDYPRLIGNLRLALTKEGLGLGPQRYCLVFDRDLHYSRFLAVVLTFLPRHKMFMYPNNLVLGGLFAHNPWLSRLRTVCSRPSLSPEEFQTHFPEET